MFAGFPPPSSRSTNFVTLVPNPGGRRDMLSEEALAAEGIAVLRRSGSTEKRRRQWPARGGGAGTIVKIGGTESSLCRAPGRGGGGCRPRGSGGVGAVRLEAGACCHPPCLGKEQGETGETRCPGYPRPEEPSPSARRRRSVRPSTKDVKYHRMAPRVRASQLVEDRAAACPGTGSRFFLFFSSLPSSSSLSLLILPSPFSRLVCPYPRYAAAALTGPLGGGGGRVERSLVGTPGLRWAMGVCDEWGGAESRGNGARPVELMIMSDTCTTHRSRVPRRSSGRIKGRSDDSGRRERTRPGF